MGRGHTTGSDWSAEEIETAAGLWKDGRSAGYIAQALGGQPQRTRNAVLGMMNRNREIFPKKKTPGKRPGGGRKGVASARAWTPEQIATARRLWAARAPAAEIGAAIGRSWAAVHDFARRHPELFPQRDAVKQQRERRADDSPRVVSLAERFPPPPAAPECKPVTLVDRRPGQCHFPLWEHYGAKPTAESLYCGGDVQGDGHYCACHRAIVYRPATAKPIKDEPLRRSDQARRRAA